MYNLLQQCIPKNITKKTNNAIDSPGTLVFWCKKLGEIPTGSPLLGAPNRGGLGSNGDFWQISCYVSETVQDWDMLQWNAINWCYFQWPWLTLTTPKHPISTCCIYLNFLYTYLRYLVVLWCSFSIVGTVFLQDCCLSWCPTSRVKVLIAEEGLSCYFPYVSHGCPLASAFLPHTYIHTHRIIWHLVWNDIENLKFLVDTKTSRRRMFRSTSCCKVPAHTAQSISDWLCTSRDDINAWESNARQQCLGLPFPGCC